MGYLRHTQRDLAFMFCSHFVMNNKVSNKLKIPNKTIKELMRSFRCVLHLNLEKRTTLLRAVSNSSSVSTVMSAVLHQKSFRFHFCGNDRSYKIITTATCRAVALHLCGSLQCPTISGFVCVAGWA